jgi:uncharacterized protein YjbI with pentapeptide repeats
MVEKPDNEGRFAWIRNPSKQGSIFQHSLVVIVPLAILASIALALGFIFAGDNSGARVRMIEASLAVIGGAGAAVALVVNYRRQQVLEEQNNRAADQEAFDRNEVLARRDIDRQETLTKHFSDFTNQLADDRVPVKLAGVYSLFRLADEWKEHRQQIIDVLCGYLRLPWPDENEEQATKVEQEVRQTILREMVARMKEGGTFTEDVYSYHFTRAVFPFSTSFQYVIFTGNCDFSDVCFAYVDFYESKFNGSADFIGCRFVGNFPGYSSVFLNVHFEGIADFTDAIFEEGLADFKGSTFYRAAYFTKVCFQRVDFSRVSFMDTVDFMGVRISVVANFSEVTFSSLVNFSSFNPLMRATTERRLLDVYSRLSEQGSLGTEFKCPVSFAGSRFLGPAYVGSVIIGEHQFPGPLFHQEVDFVGANLNREVDFDPSCFLSRADFTNVNIWPNGIADPAPDNITVSICHKDQEGTSI